MRILTAGQVAALAGGRCAGDHARLVGPGVVADSRQVGPGALFVALPGEHADGRQFAAAAVAQRAAAVLAASELPGLGVPTIVALDPLRGLADLARGVVTEARAAGLTTLALTGSAGKTTTKDILAQLLDPDGPTVAPQGSWNNELGVPLTACRVDASTRYLVSEMGARGAGHIAWLCGITPPTVAAVTNVGTAHLGEFGSQEGIAAAKGEIVEALPSGGWAVLNADDALVAGMAARTDARVAWFSAGAPVVPAATLNEAPLSVRATGSRADDLERYGFTLTGSADGRGFAHAVRLPLVGRHLVADALAAAAMALAVGLHPGDVAARLGHLVPRSPWRMALHELPGGAVLVNDAYNANPDSVAAALDTVGRMIAARRRQWPQARACAVLGDMLELGPLAPALHREAGSRAARCGVSVLAVGQYAADVVAGARESGGQARVVQYADVPDAVPTGAGDVVLFKASRGLGLPASELDRRGLGLERLVAAVLEGQGGQTR
ncbi:MAG: UDP-N-acetylmuramoyl-tripeptide--D-alanyl-D-alanine ligase [Actinomycetia bacterium]|nr:UDP-N-acetylmuramoyl-tripeptide--D-alanyl-D-alanine ligase [Actinomycetes bacterium]